MLINSSIKIIKHMVRLEKIAYEQIVNTAALGRSRALSTPRKWNAVNHMDHTRSTIYIKPRINS